MKKIILKAGILLALLFMTGVMPAYSIKHIIQVGNYFFNPSSVPGVNAGDTIRWVWVAGSHTTTSSTIPGGAASWDELITSSNQTYDYVPTVGGTYNYVCTPHVGMGMVGSFTVTAAAPLMVSATADPDNICGGSSSMLFCFPEGGTGSYTYQWTSSPPGFNSNQQNVQVTPGQTTQYTITVTSGPQTASASVTVTVQPAPAITASNDTTYCDNVTSFDVSATGSNYGSVNWTTSGDGTFTNGNTLTPVYMPGVTDLTLSSVDLTVHATGIAPCSSTVTDVVHITFVLCTGINDNKHGTLSMSVYPNPSSGQFSLRTGTLTGTASLRIFDMQGRVVYSEMVNTDNSELKINGLSPGIYQATISDGEQKGTVRIFVR